MRARSEAVRVATLDTVQETLLDPQERLVLVLMIQQLPNRSTVPVRFPMLVYQALVQPR